MGSTIINITLTISTENPREAADIASDFLRSGRFDKRIIYSEVADEAIVYNADGDEIFNGYADNFTDGQ